MSAQDDAGVLLSSKRSLKPIFEPQAIAVIGASRRKEAVGYAILANLVSGGFKGKIHPVNPKADTIEGLECCHAINDLPEGIDLGVVIVPSTAVPETLELCGQKGVQSAIVISAGFREIGGEGTRLEREAAETAKKYRMPVLGPNCLGLINTDPAISINASFSRTMPRPGNIAFVSQSGALCAAILDYAKGEDIGFSKFVSLGNKADINELCILRYLKDDPKTDVILMYLEDLVDGARFIHLAREITGDLVKPKPILAIKAGRTLQGAKAASSHTGSLMGSDEVYDAIFAQAGVLRVDSVEEIFDLATAFAYQAIPRSKRVAIVTNAGGPGIMATDACVRYGLEMAEISSATQEALRKVLPPTANFSNPVDVIGDAQHDRYEHALTCVLGDSNVDGVIVILTPQAMTDIEEIAHAIVRMNQKTKKTILTSFMGFVDVSPGIKILEEHHVPHYKFPEEAARALGAMIRYKQWIIRPRTEVRSFPIDSVGVRSIIQQAKEKNQRLLTTHQAMEILKAYGFPLLPYEFASFAPQAGAKAEKIGFPVAIKIVSPDIVHKLDVGGVRLNLKSAAEVERAFKEMTSAVLKFQPAAKIDGVLVQAMGMKGREVILGMNRDPHFGPILMFGLGGTYVEVFKDVTFRLAPIRELGARRMIESIRAYAILKGIRGEEPADLEKIIECLQRLSQLASNEPDVSEVDINPLVVYRKKEGAQVVDARIVLKI
ncbi:MAG: acetate--CoA ligase family protein [Candidatus Omnitrophica bacterium]|nr:acetate--CoA ligase family protein [Candidatus Omnitrophota bacterium]